MKTKSRAGKARTKNGPSKRVGSGRLVGVRLQFSRTNMETLESILAMYEDSEDAQVRRIATTARRRVTKALAEAEPQPNKVHDPRGGKAL